MKIKTLVFITIFLIFSCQTEQYPQDTPQINHSGDKSILKNENYYSIQICQIPLDKIDEILRIYNSLKSKYFVFYYNGSNEENFRIREAKINVGVFESKFEAANYINTLNNLEGCNSKLDSVQLFVDNYKNEFDIITTPNAIWKRQSNHTEELFLFDSTTIQMPSTSKYSKAVISPDGSNVVFYFNKKIIKLNLKSLKPNILVENSDVHFWGLFNSQPRWSYDGKFIAFLDDFAWESKTSLWIIESDGTNLTCLVDNTIKKDQQAVKSFLWHPSQLGLLFVEGFAYGTITLGGNLYSVDIKGIRKEVVTANKNKRQEIYNYFTLEIDYLIYEIVQFDEEYMKHEKIQHITKLPDI